MASNKFETDELSFPFGYCWNCTADVPVELYDISDLVDVEIQQLILKETPSFKGTIVVCGICLSWMNKKSPVKLTHYGESQLRLLGWKIAPGKETRQGISGPEESGREDLS